MRLTVTVILAAAVALTACDSSQSPTPPAAGASTDAPSPATPDGRPAVTAMNLPFSREGAAAALSIDAEAMRATVAEISSDAYGGRGPGTEGDLMTRRYLAGQLAAHGLKPGGTDGWEQVFDLVGIESAQPPQWVFQSDDQQLVLEQHSEFIVGAGMQAAKSEVNDAELVFVGYGIEAPEYKWDDFKDHDLRGKVLVILNNDPDWDENLFAGKRRLYYGRWRYKYESAARQGAVGAIIIHTTPSAGYGWQVIQSSWTGPQFELPAGDEPRLQVAGWVTDSAAAQLFSLGGQSIDELRLQARSRDFEPVPLGVNTSIAFTNTLQRTQSANVLGVLPGSDPVLSKQAVIYTAHHDHIGTGNPDENGDRIYNGARDNATGCAMLLEIGKAFAQLDPPPRRSIVIAFVGAEEQGLLGSQHYSANPTFAPGRIAANINFDSANIWGPTNDMTYIGKGKSSLDAITDRVADFYGRIVLPDQFPDQGLFYRSDQFNLARIGVPALYLKGGTDFIGRPAGWGRKKVNEYTAVHYHQQSDELTGDWNFDGMLNDAMFGFWAGYLIANADEMPHWYPGDEFEAARLDAIKALQ